METWFACPWFAGPSSPIAYTQPMTASASPAPDASLFGLKGPAWEDWFDEAPRVAAAARSGQGRAPIEPGRWAAMTQRWWEHAADLPTALTQVGVAELRNQWQHMSAQLGSRAGPWARMVHHPLGDTARVHDDRPVRDPMVVLGLLEVAAMGVLRHPNPSEGTLLRTFRLLVEWAQWEPLRPPIRPTDQADGWPALDRLLLALPMKAMAAHTAQGWPAFDPASTSSAWIKAVERLPLALRPPQNLGWLLSRGTAPAVVALAPLWLRAGVAPTVPTVDQWEARVAPLLADPKKQTGPVRAECLTAFTAHLRQAHLAHAWNPEPSAASPLARPRL